VELLERLILGEAQVHILKITQQNNEKPLQILKKEVFT
jgi:hypothetical protein